MAPKHASVLILLLAACILVPGCTAPSGGGGPTGGTQVPPAPRPPGTGPVVASPPGPAVTVPPDYHVEIQVNKNMIFVDPAIDVFFRGGKGQIFLQKMFVQVYKSDGTYEAGQLVRPAGGQISVGDKVTIMGTTGTDRVVVTVTILGKDYTIHDRNYEFKTRP